MDLSQETRVKSRLTFGLCSLWTQIFIIFCQILIAFFFTFALPLFVNMSYFIFSIVTVICKLFMLDLLVFFSVNRWPPRYEQWWECKFLCEGIIDQGGGFRDSLSDLAEELCPSSASDPVPLPFFVRTPNHVGLNSLSFITYLIHLNVFLSESFLKLVLRFWDLCFVHTYVGCFLIAIRATPMQLIAVILSFPTRTAMNFSGTSGSGRSWGLVSAAKKVWSVGNFMKQFRTVNDCSFKNCTFSQFLEFNVCSVFVF